MATFHSRSPVGAVYDNSPLGGSFGVLKAFVRVDRRAAPPTRPAAPTSWKPWEKSSARARVPVDFAEMAWSEEG